MMRLPFVAGTVIFSICYLECAFAQSWSRVGTNDYIGLFEDSEFVKELGMSDKDGAILAGAIDQLYLDCRDQILDSRKQEQKAILLLSASASIAERQALKNRFRRERAEIELTFVGIIEKTIRDSLEDRQEERFEQLIRHSIINSHGLASFLLSDFVKNKLKITDQSSKRISSQADKLQSEFNDDLARLRERYRKKLLQDHPNVKDAIMKNMGKPAKIGAFRVPF